MAKCGGCGGKAARERASQPLVPGYTATYNENGMTVLGSWLDCTEPYDGAHQRDDVFVMGLGTVGERIFRTDQRREALDYGKAENLKLTRLTARTLCHEAMVGLFGA